MDKPPNVRILPKVSFMPTKAALILVYLLHYFLHTINFWWLFLDISGFLQHLK